MDMRKIILLFLALVLMCSCEPVKTLPYENSHIGKTDTLRVPVGKPGEKVYPMYDRIYAKHLRVKSHDYLLIHFGGTDTKYMVEDPDCKECARLRDSISNSIVERITVAIDSLAADNKADAESLNKSVSTVIRKLNTIQNSLIDYD